MENDIDELKRIYRRGLNQEVLVIDLIGAWFGQELSSPEDVDVHNHTCKRLHRIMGFRESTRKDGKIENEPKYNVFISKVAEIVLHL